MFFEVDPHTAYELGIARPHLAHELGILCSKSISTSAIKLKPDVRSITISQQDCSFPLPVAATYGIFDKNGNVLQAWYGRTNLRLRAYLFMDTGVAF